MRRCSFSPLFFQHLFFRSVEEDRNTSNYTIPSTPFVFTFFRFRFPFNFFRRSSYITLLTVGSVCANASNEMEISTQNNNTYKSVLQLKAKMTSYTFENSLREGGAYQMPDNSECERIQRL